MQTEKLLKHIVGQNIDDAVNLDLRGTGYPASCTVQRAPVASHRYV